MPDATPHAHRWNRDEYDRAAAAGVFGTTPRIELLDGEVVEVTPQGSRHVTGMRRVEKALQCAFGAGCDVRTQVPLAADEYSEPEPDVAVVEGDVRDYRDAHPTTALLIVEVPDDSLRRDRTVKQRLYARCGIPEYWILSLPDARLEVHRDPSAEGYRTVAILQAGAAVTPLARPEAAIPVDDLLP